MRVYAHIRNIVVLVRLKGGWKFTVKHYELLLELQHEVPNLALEIESGDDKVRQFVAAHQLYLENFRSLSLLNAAA